MSRSLELPATLASVDDALAWARAEAPDWVDPDAIDFGLVELITNAIVHGSVPPDGGSPGTLALHIEVHDCACGFTVEWSLVACSEQCRTARTADVWETSGRGLLIAQASFDRLIWRDDGLAITAELGRPA